MSRVHVVKMSGAGNDFVVLGADEAQRLGAAFEPWVRRVCRRGLSVGADGVLVVESAGAGAVNVRFHNPDGSPAFCGNASRCAARYAWRRGLVDSGSMVLRTAAGEVRARVEEGRVQLELSPPEDLGELKLDVGAERLVGRRVDSGAPHFVVFVESVAGAPLERWGPLVRRHAQFAPAGTNLDVAQFRAADRLDLRTWERGVEGETLACGSGALAAAAAARQLRGGDRFTVRPASGIPLEVDFRGGTVVRLAGDARFVFEGELDPEALDGFV
ncbi:MAG TPA: diaminopimelate epimerase [Candidatus Polarisedimenticolaceae bacterium]|nr:diaminopimelate epimerase [Candidatus Polarisedimenticolaceae bacterium]